MEKTPPQKTSPNQEFQLRMFRERMAAVISLLIVVSSFIMIGIAMSLVGNPEQFSLAKDLLLFVNPILGIALGYFFNKITSDARSETAEKAADAAGITAQQAAEARNQAVAETEAMRTETDAMKGVLHDLVSCSEDMLAQNEAAPKTPRTLGVERGGETPMPTPDAMRSRAALEAALNRAQKWMNP